MVVFPQLVSDVKDRSRFQAQRLNARSPIPTECRPGSATSPLDQLQADVAILDSTRRSCHAHVVSDEDGFLISIAQRFKAAQPAVQSISDLIQREHRVAAQDGRRILYVQRGPGFDAALQLLQARSRQTKAHRVRMATKAGKELLAAFDGLQKMKTWNGAAGAVSLAAFERDHDCRTPRPVDHARGEDANDAAMPAFAFDHDTTACREGRFVAQTAVYFFQHGGFRLLPLAVQAIEFRCELTCPD